MKEIYDLHVHTHYSVDADRSEENSILNKARKAKKAGYSGIAFTDHFDADLDIKRIEVHDSESIARDVFSAKEELECESFKIFHGIEIGTQWFFKDYCSEKLKRYDYDIVISSIHNLPDTPYYWISKVNFSEISDSDIKAAQLCYLTALMRTAKECDFDTLAHITYINRYFKRFGRQSLVPHCEYYDLYDEIFRSLIFRGKALEVNTSGLRQGHGETLPGTELIKRYIELGGELFTIGSDSHSPCDMFSDIKSTAEALASYGAKYLCIFEKRNPIYIKL